MGESRRQPVIAPNAVLGNRFNTGGEGEKLYSQNIALFRALQSRVKIMYEAKLRHASTPFSSRNASTATIYIGWDQRNDQLNK